MGRARSCKRSSSPPRQDCPSNIKSPACEVLYFIGLTAALVTGLRRNRSAYEIAAEYTHDAGPQKVATKAQPDIFPKHLCYRSF
jgi:hypothetical protein